MIRRILIIFCSALFLVITALFGVLAVAFLGPSNSTRDKLTLSLLETSAAKFVPNIFLTSSTIDEIKEGNSVIETSAVTDTSLVTTFKPQAASTTSEDGEDNAAPEDDEWAGYPDGIRIEPVKGSTYRGYAMLIRDPSRVYTGASSNFRSDAPGLRILDIVNRDGAVAAINGGGFPDVNGVGVGDVPIGMVFSKGELLWGSEGAVYSSVMGFNNDNVFIVGNMSPRQAREMGIRDAICFGPILVVNGEPAQIRGMSGSLNPRSAIGQRADGTVIFLCIDGRMPSSMGASYSDLVEIMLELGAVNAANLDGGSSSHLVYNGELVNISSSLYGPRRMPTFFLVAGNDASDAEQ